MKTKLERYLIDHGISIKWLAEKTGLNYARLHKVVKGIAELKAIDACIIADALECNVRDIIGYIA